MSYIYEHLPEGEDIGFEERSYSLTEGLLDYKGRKILYLKVEASAITFCDRSYAPHLGSINVRGYVLRWKYGTSGKREQLSEIEPVMSEEERQEITRILKETYNMSNVRFV